MPVSAFLTSSGFLKAALIDMELVTHTWNACIRFPTSSSAFLQAMNEESHRQLLMDLLSFRNNQLKVKTSGELLIILEESLESTSNQ